MVLADTAPPIIAVSIRLEMPLVLLANSQLMSVATCV